MKHRKILFVLFISIGILFSSADTVAQGVCVIGEKKLANLKGLVRQVDKQVIPEALIKVYRKSSDEKLISEAKADAKGLFEVTGLATGKYSVIVSYPNFVELKFPVRIVKKVMRESKQLAIVLGWNYNEPCGGGEVLVE